MQDLVEMRIIAHFLGTHACFILGLIQAILSATGLSYTEIGDGLDKTLRIHRGQRTVEFYLYNLLIEIATVNRDANPLQFDVQLNNPGYALAKIVHLIESKLRILMPLLGHDDIDVAINDIARLAKEYERIRIIQFDPPSSA